MEKMQFHVPVRLRLNGELHEIESVRSAASFLHEWPASRRGPVFNCALNGCHAAIGGMVKVEDARKAFESFARITGILAPIATADVRVIASRAAVGAASTAH